MCTLYVRKLTLLDLMTLILTVENNMYIKTIIQSSSLLMPYPTAREASFMQPISMAAYSSSLQQ